MRQRLPKGFKVQLAEDIRQAIADVVQSHGFEVQLTEPRHNRGVMSFAVKLMKQSQGAHEAAEYVKYAEANGMKPEWLTQEFQFDQDEDGKTYALIGWDQRKKKMKVVLLDPEGNRVYQAPSVIINFATFVEKSTEVEEIDAS